MPVPDLLTDALTLTGRITTASNATFLGSIGDAAVVYKPMAGEKPLWDFPDGCLAHREVAAYLVSEALGWNIVPRTSLRDGPLGEGMVQLALRPVAHDGGVPRPERRDACRSLAAVLGPGSHGPPGRPL